MDGPSVRRIKVLLKLLGSDSIYPKFESLGETAMAAIEPKPGWFIKDVRRAAERLTEWSSTSESVVQSHTIQPVDSQSAQPISTGRQPVGRDNSE